MFNTTGRMMCPSGGIYGNRSEIAPGVFFYYDPGNISSYSGSGTTLYDLSGNSNNATIANSPSHTSGRGGYFTFDGVNDYIMSPSIYNGSNETHTVEVWVYPTNINLSVWSDLGQPVVNDDYHFAGSQIYMVGPIYQAVTALWNSTSTTRVVNHASATSFLNNWQQIVRVYDGTNLIPYYNGQRNTSTVVNFDSPYNDGIGDWRLAFGARDTTTYGSSVANYFVGRYGVIRYYKRALSEEEVLNNYRYDKSKYSL